MTPDLAASLAESVRPAQAIVLCAQIEAEVAGLDAADAAELLRSYGQEESGLEQLVHVGFATLGLQTFLTAGPKEARAWTIHIGDTAPKAAGVIHTDFERGFIKAEVISFEDLMDGGLGRRGPHRRPGPDGGQGLRHARRRRRRVPLQHLGGTGCSAIGVAIGGRRGDAEGRRDLLALRIDHVPEAAVLVDGLAHDDAGRDVAVVGVERVAAVGELGRAVGPVERAHQ